MMRKAHMLLSLLLVLPLPAHAHNESVHQRMTDFAYHVLLAGARYDEGGEMAGRLRSVLDNLNQADPEFAGLFAAAAAAVPRLQAIQSGLPMDMAPCVSDGLEEIFGGPFPDWALPEGTMLAALSLGQVRLPVGINYGYGGMVCDINESYQPSGLLNSLNPGPLVERDHTGVTLGYWAASPDKATKDWVLRSTTLETLQNPAVLAATAAAVSVQVSALCVLACGFFPPACVACPVVAIGSAGVVIDEITSVDADSLESEDYIGFGHFIDMKPTPASPTQYDIKPAKLSERAGPTGTPDLVEDLVTVLFDIGGIHVNYDASDAPKDYQITTDGSGAIGPDFHRNSIARTAEEWELPTIPHMQLTAVDNLALFGYEQAKLGGTTQAKRLGWPLHALADATVPMHAVGASGYGHRPYEDRVEIVFDALVGADSIADSAATIADVMQRTLRWRKFIEGMRVMRGTTEVPVRNLVTAVAAVVRQRANAQPAVYQAQLSLQYLLDADAAIAGYDTPVLNAMQKDLLLEGIAAEAAFLIAVTEVTP